VKVTLGGIMRRLGQGSVARPALERSILAADPYSFWALNDGPLAEAGLLTHGVGEAFQSLNWGDAVAPGTEDMGEWLGPGILLTDDSAITSEVPLPASPSRVTIDAVYKFNHVESANTQIIGMTLAAVPTFATGSRWPLQVEYSTSAGGSIIGGSPGFTVTNFVTDDVLGGPHHLRWDLIVDGSDVDYHAYLDGVEVLSATAVGTSLAGLKHVRMFNDGADGSTGAWTDFGIWVDETPPDVEQMAAAATAGYAGEQAHERFERIMTEEGLPYESTAIISVEVGPQPIGDVLEICRDLENVDHGILSELTSTWGLGYRASSQRYNLSPAMTIDLSTYRTSEGTSAGVLRPVRNDQRIRNEWTISRPGGSSRTFKDEAHQAKRGRYNDSAEVNVAGDVQLLGEASFRVREDTDGSLRYAAFPIDLGANASTLLPDWLEMSLGDRIDRSNTPSQHPTDTVSVVVVGYTMGVRRRGWDLAPVVEPYEPWRVQQLTEDPPDDATLDGWAVPDVFALRAAVDDNDTSWVADCWPRMTTDADDMPCRITVAGEENAITAVATTAATYVAVGAADADDNAAVTPGDYAGGAVGDWIVVEAGSRDTTSPTLAITDPNYTYDLLGHQGGLYVWAAFRTASAPAPTVTPSGGAAGDTVQAQVFGLRGMPITGSPSDWILDYIGQTNSSAQDIAYGRLAAGGYAGRVILFFGRKSDDWTSAAISGPLEITETTSTSGNDQSLYGARRIDTTPTVVGGSSITVTGGSTAVSDSLVIALQGGYQTFTVTRSVNNVEKSHAVGSAIELLDPIVPSL